MSNEKKSATLGMPFGTACNRLRKNILFSLLVRLQENVCFKCGELILSVNDLSIEHKQPWEGRDSNLFWDLNNIAYSHLGCNLPHRFKLPDPNLKHGTPGMWDRGCRCEACTQWSREYQRDYRARYPERRKKSVAAVKTGD